MPSPTDRKYSTEHEWALVEPDGTALVGITHFAQEELGDVVYLELPAPGTELRQFQNMGEIESVKAVSELFAPVSGRVLEGNATLKARPELVNQDPYGAGWLVRVRVDDTSELSNLLDAAQYDLHLSGR